MCSVSESICGSGNCVGYRRAAAAAAAAFDVNAFDVCAFAQPFDVLTLEKLLSNGAVGDALITDVSFADTDVVAIAMVALNFPSASNAFAAIIVSTGFR